MHDYDGPNLGIQSIHAKVNLMSSYRPTDNGPDKAD